MGQKISWAGSTKRKQILEKGKTREDSIWELHINATDVNNKLVELQQENEQKLASRYLHGLHLEKELEVAKKEITRKTSENKEPGAYKRREAAQRSIKLMVLTIVE